MTRIVADTTCGLAPGAARDLGIPMISQIINFGETSFREGIDIDHATFMSMLRHSRELPKTSAPYPGDFIEAFREPAAAGESIVCIHPSAEVSGTVRSAQTARESFPDADIRIIDTRTVAGPLASIVLESHTLARSGAAADEIVTCVHSLMQRARIYFLVDTMEYLQRGGRIGGASALVGTILQIKPILTFRNGRVEPLGRERTKRRALARLRELVMAEAARGNASHLTVMHSSARDEAEALAADLAAGLGVSNALIMDLVPAIVTHAGPGALAAGFFAPDQKGE